MNKKQTKALILAALLFVLVGISSVLTNTVVPKLFAGTEESTSSSSFESLFGSMSDAESNRFSDMPTTEDFIAVLPIEGTIQPSVDTGSFYGTTTGYDHDMLMDYVDCLMENESNKGIVLSLDTPGGTVYEADELYLKLMEYKRVTNRPIYAYMKSMCCSGGVYIASASDEQYANRITNTGSIGVIISMYDMSKLYEKLGIKEVNIASADNKAMGSAAEPLTAEQRAIYQSMIDEYYELFVGIVAEGRDMSVEEVKTLADGRIYTASQAVENGLIDGIKGEDEFYQYVEEASGVANFYEPSQESDPFSMLFGSVAQTKEKSEAEVLVDFMNQLGSGVPMYYANPIE